MANEILRAVGIEIRPAVSWLPDVGPVPSSYKSADAVNNWIAKERGKRLCSAVNAAWIGEVKRIVFADPVSFAVLFDSSSETKTPAAVSAYLWLLQDGLAVDPQFGMSSHTLFGWRLTSAIRPWGSELVYRVSRGEDVPAPPLRFWQSPKKVYSVLPQVISSTERRWIPPESWGARLGLSCNPTDSAITQLEGLARLSELVGLTDALAGSDMGMADYSDIDGEFA